MSKSIKLTDHTYVELKALSRVYGLPMNFLADVALEACLREPQWFANQIDEIAADPNDNRVVRTKGK